jgi:hypothetical protein
MLLNLQSCRLYLRLNSLSAKAHVPRVTGMDLRSSSPPPLRLLERPLRRLPPAAPPAPPAWWQRWLPFGAARSR